MPDPLYGVPDDQGTPWSQYDGNGAGAPMQDMPMQSMPIQGGPQNFQGHGGSVPMPIVKGPSKVPGTILIALGALAPFVAVSILFFVLWFQGVTDMVGVLAQDTTFSNGGTVKVGGTDSYMLQISSGEAATCRTINLGNNAYDMSSSQSDKSLYYIDGLSSGTYTAHCEGVDQKAPMTGMSVGPNDFTGAIGFAFLWSTVVGAAGVVLLIVGIVLVVRTGDKAKELQQQVMTLVMCWPI